MDSREIDAFAERLDSALQRTLHQIVLDQWYQADSKGEADRPKIRVQPSDWTEAQARSRERREMDGAFAILRRRQTQLTDYNFRPREQ